MTTGRRIVAINLFAASLLWTSDDEGVTWLARPVGCGSEDYGQIFTGHAATASDATAADGSLCGTGLYCLNGECQTPYYTDLTGSSESIITNCSGCHGFTTSEAACQGACFAQCYSDAKKDAPACPAPAASGQPVYKCMAAAMQAYKMPPGCSATSQSSGCPSADEIAVIAAWASGGALCGQRHGTRLHHPLGPRDPCTG